MDVKEMAMAAAAAAAAGGSGGGGSKLPPPNPNLPYREDCWSDGETDALVDAWSTRYMEVNRGNVRQKQWQEVADAVNSRPGASARGRPPRTDVQCKNRVDTLKKRYKAERARNTPSSWRLFKKLDGLVGPTLGSSASRRPSPSAPPQFAMAVQRKPPSTSLPPSLPLALPLPNYRRGSLLPSAALIQQEAAAAAAAMTDSMTESMTDPEDSADAGGNNNYNRQQSPSRSISLLSGNSKKRSRHEASSSGNTGFREVARAIEAFTEMYERVENVKLQHALEMERRQMEFLKELEVKRMEIFVDAHVKLLGAKRTKKTAAAGDAAGAELVATVAALPFGSSPAFH